ncbi:MAG: hypothetical protein A3C85_01285 [Candidatus Doudnabacteria bacterium RIFCSPHIGHO2_02_FULL_48_21]|uniref:Undecaprenyl-phosphate alpha-N-acetylglucosaminyl 1-phosphate transferase n=1 Tax=Candidatus Doudnabacteria bacterium RIFCSPLOWO2_02_FULL_48_13 TaxID=1817845 RepID=A0A1F5Q9B2_9BACT|nr:MAG: hypothetical protein A3K05_04330 [Candidatus Doudnabacteria bacterium RIFCSPHIGHO2_01_48_18]OGE79590.1 MAG: hypothetical protein A2668_03340 [Candidatus Doudnabacteria bacterium RIFCSPHIGHO2_01_FULL_48_180]OGE91117.1 MAG: hypothetical protein A3F44_02225 [Candidatus Doudnabacteria bacterium RIFCSPHIGHO2_12_FULL_47_25]OGE93807.1 MAG: hypothetical protein A3C85_01285 [Candidatus Doudnabacteria bacterium RIFCSPHIGHO2_02_FULL_48_21]OGE97993.1 MAG: hypothetical protein A3A83_00870 [Candidatu
MISDPKLFVLVFAAFFLISFLITKFVRRVAFELGIQDIPDSDRKIHDKPRPKLGGSALYLSFAFGVMCLALLGLTDEISATRIAALLIGALILIVGGILDDKYDLPAYVQIVFPVAAALAVVGSGIHISYITNPFGGEIILDQWKLGGFPVLGSLVVFLWILGMTYTTKFLDGMDGLVSGISGIAGIVIFGLSLAPDVLQTTTAFLALIFAAVCFGFLPFNFHPARIFLGEGGSTFTGFMIGVLAVISGGKIATALLVLGIPIMDAAWVIVRRLWYGSSPFVGDKKHLHFRLLDVGLSQRQAVLFLYFLSAVFGGIAVFLQSWGKLIALGAMFLVMIVVAMAVVIIYRKKSVTPKK